MSDQCPICDRPKKKVKNGRKPAFCDICTPLMSNIWVKKKYDLSKMCDLLRKAKKEALILEIIINNMDAKPADIAKSLSGHLLIKKL